MDGDPILEAYRLWIENGWADCADGLAAVTSIIRVRQVLSIRADQVLAPIDLTFSRYELLVRLYFRDDGALPLSQLGKQLQIHQTSITSLVDKLESQGLIRRAPHPTDRRSTIAQITPAGRALTGKAINLLNSELYRDLGLTGDEGRQLIGLLMKMRLSWDDIENQAGWEPFKPGPPRPLPRRRRDRPAGVPVQTRPVTFRCRGGKVILTDQSNYVAAPTEGNLPWETRGESSRSSARAGRWAPPCPAGWPRSRTPTWCSATSARTR